jgi:uncharacterized protein (TIGR01777 family)
MRVLLAGSSGFIGSALRRHLHDRGDEVIRLVRRPATARDERSWDPAAGRLDTAVFDGVDAVVNLGGAGVGDRRWSPAYKAELVASRVDGTATLAAGLSACRQPVRWVNGSAVGYYGNDNADTVLTEDSPAGGGFLADLVQRWEGATAPAVAAGVPVALARSGLVMAAGGGAFHRMTLLGRLGLGGPLGSGRQYWPWITLTDEVRALAFLIDRVDLTGPVNLTGPAPAPQREIAAAIGRRFGRPAVLPAPAFALRAALGEFAEDILGSQRAVPHRLLDAGFGFQHPTVAAAVDTLS